MITNTNKYKKKRLYTLILLLSLFSVSFLTLGIDFLNTGVIDQENRDEDTGSAFNPVTSAGIGEDQWWNESYQWRQCLNITNPGSFDLKNNIIKYSLNYNTLSDVQSDLDDVRIVENGILRKYYMKIDYPKTDYVTIWFETNVSAGATDYDTYIYYGNSSVGRADSYYLENCPEGIAQWNFDYDDPANSFVNETLSNLYHGELSSQMDSNNYITGKWGNGIQIDMSETAGDGEYIALNMSYTTGTATAPSGYEPTNLHGYISEFTASAWVKMSEDNGGWSILDFDRSEYWNMPVGSPAYQTTDGTLEFGSNHDSPTDSSSTNDMAGSVSVDDGDWHHVLISFNADNSTFNEKKIYVDGVLDYPPSYYEGDTSVTIGKDNQIRFGFIGIGSEATTFDGSKNPETTHRSGVLNLDDVRIYDYSLSDREIKWFANYYPLKVDSLGEVEQSATVSIYVKDIDGRFVEGAEVALWNQTEILNGTFIEFSDENGLAEFYSVPFGTYNVTVNYTLNSEAGVYEQVVYDTRTTPGNEITFQGLYYSDTVYADLWTIEFEVDDFDGDAMNYGYINVSAKGESTEIEKLTLDNEGKATFVWLASNGFYNYSVYYYNPDYTTSSTLINASTITRSPKYQQFYVNQTDSSTVPGIYKVTDSIYIPGASSGYNGLNQVVEARLECSNMQDNLTQIIMNYYEQGDPDPPSTQEIVSYSTETSAELTYYPMVENDNIYGIQFEIYGENDTVSNGIIDINLTYTYYYKIQTNMSKLSIRVLDNTGTQPVSGMTVRVEYNGTENTVVELESQQGTGYAYGEYTTDFSFWYLTGTTYNFSVWLVTEGYDFDVNTSDKATPTLTDYYNYTLTGASDLVFHIDLDFTSRLANFANTSGPSSLIWGENMTFSAIYNTTTTDGSTWRTDYNRDGKQTSATWTIYNNKGTKLLELPMTRADSIGSESGKFTITVNSSQFSAGGTGKSYYVYITGHKDAWRDPNPQYFGFTINPKTTSLDVLNYTTKTEITGNDISEYYNELVNVSFIYNNTDDKELLSAESFTYQWDYGSGNILSDPLNAGYYYLTIDTSLTPNVGRYKFDISANLENYTSKDTSFFLEVLERKTIINGTDGLLHVSKNYRALETHYIYFEYNDTETGRLASLDEQSYTWYRLAEDGSALTGLGNEGSGVLNSTSNNIYLLDFDTELRAVGEYLIYVTLDKNNYETRNSIINLEIQERPTTSLINDSPTTPYLQGINLGDAVNFSISYNDTLLSSVITNLDNYNYSYSGPETGSGLLVYDATQELYILDLDTESLTNGTYNILISLDKVNYEEKLKTITLTITRISGLYQTQFTAVSTTPTNLTGNVFWGDEITIDFTFQNSSTGGTYWNDTTPDSLNLQFYDLSDTPLLVAPISLLSYDTGFGNYSFTFNTSQYSFIGGNTYYLKITGGQVDYNPADPIQKSFNVRGVPTSIQILNYTTNTQFGSDQTIVYWNQQFNLSIYYETTSGAPLTDATVSFSWTYGSGQITSDPLKGAGYYTFEFDSGNATNIGSYLVQFTAFKQNYTTKTPTFTMIIINRPTELNSTKGVLYQSEKIFVKEAVNFTFKFTDSLTSINIDSADRLEFILNKLDSQGAIIADSEINGYLVETSSNLYVLDLNTENLAYGEYSIVITLDKDNYELKTAIMSLTINKKEFAYTSSLPSSVRIDSGASFTMTISLTDPNNNSVPVVDADVFLILKWQRYDFTDNGDGNYTLTLSKISDPFFTPEFNTINLYIQKANYTTKQLPINVEVKMAEIFPGFPTFYFLMIVGAAIAVVGSLAAYRAIQIMRIPTFVKKARKMKKEIQGRKSISDSNLYPSKEEFITERYGEDWTELGLSIEKTLGIQGKSMKQQPKKTDDGGAQ